MPQAKVLIVKFKLPSQTIMGKPTYIILLWQVICSHLEKKEHSTCTVFTSGTETLRGIMRNWKWLVFNGHNKVQAARPVSCRRESRCIICPMELTETEKYWSGRKSALHQITFYFSLNKNFLGCLQLSQLGSWFIDHKCMHRAILLMMCCGLREL